MDDSQRRDKGKINSAAALPTQTRFIQECYEHRLGHEGISEYALSHTANQHSLTPAVLRCSTIRVDAAMSPLAALASPALPLLYPLFQL